MNGLLSGLYQISPWWWFGFALILGVIEMLSFSMYLIWPALGALAVAIALMIAPDLSGETQIILFAVASVGLTLAGRRIIALKGDGGPRNPTLNNRANLMVGKIGEVVEFAESIGRIVVNETYWSAKWSEGQRAKPGDKVKVVGAEGQTLVVETITG